MFWGRGGEGRGGEGRGEEGRGGERRGGEGRGARNDLGGGGGGGGGTKDLVLPSPLCGDDDWYTLRKWRPESLSDTS